MSKQEDWAMERARKLMSAACDTVIEAVAYDAGHRDHERGMRVLADYIRRHEQPPVDPDLIEARKYCNSIAEPGLCSVDYTSGAYDDHAVVRAALAAIKRGRELEREGK